MCFEALLVGGGLKDFHWSQFLSQCLKKGFLFHMDHLNSDTHVCVMGLLLIIFTDKCFLLNGSGKLASWLDTSQGLVGAGLLISVYLMEIPSGL